MFLKSASYIRRVHQRYIGVFIQLTLGLSILLAPTRQGGVVSFLERRAGLPAVTLGAILIVSGVIGGFAPRPVIFSLTLLVFALWSLTALVGMAFSEVTFQSFVFSIGVLLYAIRAFAETNGNGHGR